MELPQIVLDTNILVAGLRSRRGASAKVLRLVGGGSFEVHLSTSLLVEYEAVLHRPHFAFTFSDVDDFINYFCSVGVKHRIPYRWRPQLPDEADEHVLELAIAAACDRIVTFNVRDFPGTERFGVRPITPSEFLRELS